MTIKQFFETLYSFAPVEPQPVKDRSGVEKMKMPRRNWNSIEISRPCKTGHYHFNVDIQPSGITWINPICSGKFYEVRQLDKVKGSKEWPHRRVMSTGSFSYFLNQFRFIPWMQWYYKKHEAKIRLICQQELNEPDLLVPAVINV